MTTSQYIIDGIGMESDGASNSIYENEHLKSQLRGMQEGRLPSPSIYDNPSLLALIQPIGQAGRIVPNTDDITNSFSALRRMATSEPQGNHQIEDVLRVRLLHMLDDVRGQLDGVGSAEGASPEVRKMIEEGQQTLAAVRDSCVSGRLDAGKAVSAVQGLMVLSARAIALSAMGGTMAGVDGVAERTAKLRASTAALYDDLFKKDVLRDSLRFDSVEDQREYEKRQRERQEAAEQARAKGTPEGDREANQINMDQLKDAENYGAASDPDFQRMKQQATVNLRAAEDLVVSSKSDEIGEALAKSGVTLSSADISVPTVPDARSTPIRSL